MRLNKTPKLFTMIEGISDERWTKLLQKDNQKYYVYWCLSKYPYEVSKYFTICLHKVELPSSYHCKAPEIGGHSTWSCRRHHMETFSALLAICAGNLPVTGEFPHKGQWRGAFTFSLMWAWINGWVNKGEAGDLTCHHDQYDVTVIL